MEFPTDSKGRQYIPDYWEGKIEDRFKNLPRESELKGKKKEETIKPKSKKK